MLVFARGRAPHAVVQERARDVGKSHRSHSGRRATRMTAKSKPRRAVKATVKAPVKTVAKAKVKAKAKAPAPKAAESPSKAKTAGSSQRTEALRRMLLEHRQEVMKEINGLIGHRMSDEIQRRGGAAPPGGGQARPAKGTARGHPLTRRRHHNAQ